MMQLSLKVRRADLKMSNSFSSDAISSLNTEDFLSCERSFALSFNRIWSQHRAYSLLLYAQKMPIGYRTHVQGCVKLPISSILIGVVWNVIGRGTSRSRQVNRFGT